MIRDTALAASGLLNDQIGGPSVLPYQPKGIWEELAFGDGFSAQSYEPSHGRDLYRRGMVQRVSGQVDGGERRCRIASNHAADK